MRLVLIFTLLTLALTGCDKKESTIESYGLRYQVANTRLMPEMTNVILAVKDFDNDGKDDLLLGGDNQGTTDKTPLYLLSSQGDGSWTDVSDSFLADSPVVANPLGVVADFNGDSISDIAILDKGNMELGQDETDGGYYGEAPQLLYSRSMNLWDSKEFLKTANDDAVVGYGFGTSQPTPGAGLHAKAVSAGDIDDDGDVDLFIESGGGWHQMWPHFAINQGGDQLGVVGTFVSDGGHTRLDLDIIRGVGPGPDFLALSWRYLSNTLADLDNDDYPDLILGQLRKEGNNQDTLASKVIFNNRSGVFPPANVVDFPYPDFNGGWAYATAVATFNFNGDAFEDVILAYQRSNSGSTTDNTGSYLQVLINNGDQTFTDATNDYINLQSMTSSTHPQYGAFINSPFKLLFKDMNGDGFDDLVMPKSTGYFSSQFPFIFINQQDNTFSPLNYQALTREQYFGDNAYPIDINGDDKIDIVTLGSTSGSDGEWGTADDKTRVITLIAD